LLPYQTGLPARQAVWRACPTTLFGRALELTEFDFIAASESALE
jgi:hypothetical protein